MLGKGEGCLYMSCKHIIFKKIKATGTLDPNVNVNVERTAGAHVDTSLDGEDDLAGTLMRRVTLTMIDE